MCLIFKDEPEVIQGMRSYFAAFVEEKIQAPVVNELKIGRQMLFLGGCAAGFPASRMPGDTLMMVVNLHPVMSSLELNIFSFVRKGNTVEVFILLESDMKIRPDRCPTVDPKFVTTPRQRRKQILFVL